MFSGHLSAQQSAVLSCTPRYGIVASYDPKTCRAKAVLAPSTDGETPMTGYLPVLAGYMGNGWGLAAPVQKGDQVIVLFMQNHPDQGVILGRIYDQSHIPPVRADGSPAAAGELVLRHQTGSLIQLGQDGKVTVIGAAEIDLTAPKIIITGDVTVNGTVTATGEGSFNGGHTVSQHDHPGVQSGSATTGKPQG